LPKFEISLKNYQYDCLDNSEFDMKISFEIEIKMKNYAEMKNIKGGYIKK
jgi:hypothetical protein